MSANQPPFKVFAEPGGVRFKIGVQTFTIDDTAYNRMEPQRQQWYVEQLTHALSKLCAPPKDAP